MLKAYKYRIYPNQEQQEWLTKIFGACRFVYNLGLETKIQAWSSARKNITCIDLSNQMKELKDTEATWLKECPSQALQMSLRNLDNAYTNFFRGEGFPAFKNKHAKQSFQLPQGVRLSDNSKQIFIPKLKWIDIDLHRNIGNGEIKTVTVSKSITNKYFVSILIDNKIESPKKKLIDKETSVGIDLGIKTLATLSDGTIFKNPYFLRKSLKNLKRQQRSLSRKKKGSKSYEKQRLIVAKLHEHIKNQREDYLHKITTSIIKKWDTIILEDLNIRGMMQNHSFALAIGEIGWYKMWKMLQYKAEWHGKNTIQIGRFEPSSKLCSCCGKINKKLILSDRIWTCKNCGVTHDRDKNAADNIKTFGLRNMPLVAKTGGYAIS